MIMTLQTMFDFFQEKMLLNCDNPTTPSEEIITWISLSLHAPNGQQSSLTKVWLVVGDVFYSPLNLLTMNPIHYVYIYTCIYIIIYTYVYIYIVIRKKIEKQFISVSVGFYVSILILGVATPSSGGPGGGYGCRKVGSSS